MLNTIRRHASDFGAKLLLAFLVLTFAVWGIGDMIRHPRGTNVATVGGKAITQGEYQRALSRELDNVRAALGERYSPEAVKSLHLPQQVLRVLIDQQLLALEAESLQVIPSDADIVRRIRENPAFANGKGFDKHVFDEQLAHAGVSEKTYVDRMRQTMASGIIMDTLTAVVPVPETALLALYDAGAQHRTATLYTLSAAAANLPAPDATQIAAYYKAHERDFTTPEYRTVSYIRLSASSDEALTKLSNALEDALAGGASMKEAAVPLGLSVHEVGPVNHEGKSPDGAAAELPKLDKFLETAFKTDEKSESPLVSSHDGNYYIVRTESITPEKVKPLADVNAQVIKGVQQESLAKNTGELAIEIAKQFADKSKRDGLITKYHLSESASGEFKRDSKELPMGLAADVFSHKPDESTAAYPAQNGTFVIAVVGDIIPAGKPDAATLGKIRQQTGTDVRRELVEEYMRYLAGKYSVSINPDMMQTADAE